MALASEQQSLRTATRLLPFEQQPRESDKAFAAFSLYLSQGPERSLAKTAVKLGRSKVLMEKWSSRLDWPARVAAYNSHMALVEREAAEALVREKGVDWARRYQELREAEWQERQNLVVFAAEVRRRWMARAERCGTLEGYARLLELASKLGHSACEKATERTEVTGPEGGPGSEWHGPDPGVAGAAVAAVRDSAAHGADWGGPGEGV